MLELLNTKGVQLKPWNFQKFKIMYLFGENNLSNKLLSHEDASNIIARAMSKKVEIQKTSIDDIILFLDSFSKLWKPESPLFHEALRGLQEEINFTPETIKETLSILPNLLSKSTLIQRLNSELGDVKVLDSFSKTPYFDGSVKAFPLGTLLHVSAGNVFLGCIDSLLMGFLTKNISLIKLSSKNQFFPLFFAKALQAHDHNSILSDKFCLLSWKGGDIALEEFFKKSVNGIIAWGGEEMLSSYRKNLPPQVKLFEYGPKISIQLLSLPSFQQNELTALASNIGRDICIFDQNACASPQNLFVQNGINLNDLISALKEALLHYPIRRGEINSDEAVEILKEKERAKYNFVLGEGTFAEGPDFLIHAESAKQLRSSPLNRTLIIKSYSNLEDLIFQLKEFSFYLQSCSYSLSTEEKNDYLNALAAIGMKRFSPIGTIMNGMTGAPHDGRYGLRELVNFIPDETPATEKKEGYFFSSGGTTGEPKFSFYSNQELEVTAKMLAYNFKIQGLDEGMVCANLFYPGNLWSSFLAVDKALQKLNVIQLPIGGAAQPDLIFNYLEQFNAEVILGIPTLLIEIAELALKKNSNYAPKLIFFAGEHLSPAARDFLNSVWKPKHIGSGGYASVDAGVMGYQCLFSKPAEHHVFSTHVNLEIINEEARVTSLYQKSFPLTQYPTGDRIEWIHESCACGSLDPKFKLLGRVDSRFNVFGCRLSIPEIDAAIAKSALPIHCYQIKIESLNLGARLPQDLVTLTIEIQENEKWNEANFLHSIFENALDVKKTYSFEKFCSFFKVIPVPPQSIFRNERTGKIKLILDLRT